MKRTLQPAVSLLAVVVGGLALLAPNASATSRTTRLDPGQVPTKLGSADPREHSPQAGAIAGLVPTLLGSQDPRDTARAVAPTATLVDVTILASSARGSQAASVVASRLGSPDRRDAVAVNPPEHRDRK